MAGIAFDNRGVADNPVAAGPAAKRPSLVDVLFLAPFLATLPLFIPNARLFHDVCGAPPSFGIIPVSMMTTCLVVSCVFMFSKGRGGALIGGARRFRLIAAAFYLAGQAAIWVLCYVFPDAPDAVPIAVGAVMGVCVPPLFVAWMALCPTDLRTALVGGSVLCIIAALLHAVFSALSPAVMTAAWCACCTVGTLAPCLVRRPVESEASELSGSGSSYMSEPSDPGSPDASRPEPAPTADATLFELVSSLWVSLLGLVVCMMMACMGGSTVDSVKVNGEYIGIACAAAVALALCFVRTDTPLVPLIDTIAIPVLAACSIVLGAIPDDVPGATLLAAGLVYVPVAFISLYAIASVMAIKGFPRLIVAGTTLAVCCFAMLVGSALIASRDVGEETGPLVCGITYCYYAIVFINLGVSAFRLMTGGARRGESQDEQREIAAEVRRRRVEELSERCGLTGREREVFDLLSLGYKSESISRTLLVSANTVRTHMKNVYRKLGVGSHEELLLLVNGRDKEVAALKAGR